MNRGIVRIVKKSKIYGNMVVIDHGLGLMTFYMHLSKSQVKVGQIVEQGKIIGLSGQTGYSLGPHLHLTVRLNNTSIDPVKFMDFFTH
jgi:murein DD-endopeptidase MepM/ murein hydrolase activator NlpD